MTRSLTWVFALSMLFFAPRALAQDVVDDGSAKELAAVDPEPDEPARADAVEPTPVVSSEPMATAEPMVATPDSLAANRDAEARLVLDDINRRSSVAAALYASSTVLLVTGAVGAFLGPILVIGGSGTTTDGSTPGQVIVGWSVFSVAILSLVGHATMLSLAIAFDAGTSYRRARLRETYPGVTARLTGGAGDVGLGFAIDF